MKYLITGSAGFIGTNLVNLLHERGEEVIQIDIDDGDLCDLNIVANMNLSLDYDIIVHLAAETDVRASIENPGMFLRNCQSTLNILEIAKASSAKLIFASSCGAPLSKSPYAASKLAGEAICNAYRESYNLDITILRFSNVYGPHSLHKNSVIAKFIKNILDNEPIKIYGSGNQQRDFVYVKDICRAIVDGQYKEATSIGSGFMTRIKDLPKMLGITKVTHLPGIPGEITFPDYSTRIPYSKSLLEGLKETFEWFEENYK